MQKTKLGSTSTDISVMGFGAMHLSLSGRPSRLDALRAIHAALDAGITFIDTSDAYCIDEQDKHHNERLVRQALDEYEGSIEDVVVATKGGLMRPKGAWPRNGKPAHLVKTISESVEALGGADPIFLWQHHAPDPAVSIEESLEAVKRTVDQGLIRHVGVSNYGVNELERAREVLDIVSVQNEFSPWHRKPLDGGVISYCEEHEITFLPYRPLGGSRRAKSVGDEPVLAELAEKYDATPHQIVLAWLRGVSPQIVPIPGSTKVAHVEDCAAAADIELTNDEVHRVADEV